MLSVETLTSENRGEERRGEERRTEEREREREREEDSNGHVEERKIRLEKQDERIEEHYNEVHETILSPNSKLLITYITLTWFILFERIQKKKKKTIFWTGKKEKDRSLFLSLESVCFLICEFEF